MPTGGASNCDTALKAELGRLVPGPKQCLTKQRYVELVQLAKIASDELIKHGLQRHEYCEFGNIMTRFMQLE